jgi:hypothetical protein
MTTVLGWFGATLVILAYAQTGTARLRQVGILASVALITFNALIGVWSNVALESVLVVINLRRLAQVRAPLRKAQPDARMATRLPIGDS